MKKKLWLLIPLCLIVVIGIVAVLLLSNSPALPHGEFSLDCYELSMEEGSTVQLNVTPALNGLQWDSSNTEVLTVENGLVSAVGTGSADVYVTGADDKAICRVTVTERKVEIPNLSVPVDQVTLFVGKTFNLQPTFGQNGQRVECSFSYEIDDESVISVDKGTITALNTGCASVSITTIYEERVYRKQIDVTVIDPANCLVLDSRQVALCYGKTVSGEDNSLLTSKELGYTLYLDGVKQPKTAEGVTFRSSDNSIVEISEDGIMTSKGIGYAVITVTFLGKDYEVDVTVGTPISTKHDLIALSEAYLNAEDKTVAPALWGADRIYVLSNNVDFYGTSFYAIAAWYRAQDGDGYWWRSGYQELNAAKPYAFAGTIDGAGHSIKNMVLAPTWSQWDGKFFIGANFIGYLSGTVRNVIFDNLTVGEKVSDPIQHAGLIACVRGGASLSQIYVRATVNCGMFASQDGLLIGQWAYSNGEGDTVSVENCVVEVSYADDWKPATTYGATSAMLCPFIPSPNSNRDANISNCYVISDDYTAEALRGSERYIGIIYPTREDLAESKTVGGLLNERFEQSIADCIIIPDGYTVKHMYGSIELMTEFIKADVGSTTQAKATKIDGFFGSSNVKQKTVEEGSVTVVTVYYSRNMLIDTFEHMPLKGNYTYGECGYMGKILLLNGNDTGYRINNQAHAIRIVNDSHNGGKAIQFQKDGYNRSATIQITLTEGQMEALRCSGGLSFWYKNNSDASIKVNGVDISTSTKWKQIYLNQAMIESSLQSGILSIELYNSWNMASIWIDDIRAYSSVGYNVQHVCGDDVLKTEFVKAKVGSTTDAKAAEIPGFVFTGEIEQTKVESGNKTVVTVQYTRDMLVNSFEQHPYPLEGDYSYQETGYENSGKILLLGGNDTGYRINYRAAAIEIVTDAYSGDKAIRFQKDGVDKHITIEITLTAEQVECIKNHGDLSFWYKNNGNTSLKVNNVEVGGSESWKQVVMDKTMLMASANSGKITLYLYGDFSTSSVWVDDIVATPAIGYTVKHMYGDAELKNEFIKAEVGSTTDAKAAEIPGFIFFGTITQTTVAEGNTTVVTVQYTRDMLVNSFEQYPYVADGNYSYQAMGYLNTGKILLLDGADTGYRIQYQAEAIEITNEAHGDGKAIRFRKNGADQHITIEIALTEEQIACIKNRGDLSFWYKNNGGSYLKVNNVDVGGSESWKQVTMDEAMLAASASSGKITLYLYGSFNASSVWVDDIVATPAIGYTVKHMYGDTELKNEFIKAEVGSTTDAKAAEIPGFVLTGTITQTTVAEGNTTVVTVQYTRDMLVNSFEQYPYAADGNYSYQAMGYLNTGKILLLDGADTGYRIQYQAEAIEITNEAHGDGKAIRFQKNGADQHITIEIALTEEQLECVKNQGDLSFWYKNNGGSHLKVNNVDVGGSESWKQVTMDEAMLAASASSGKITLYLYGSFNASSIWVDDIVATPAIGYTVKHMYGDTELKNEFIKAEVGSTTAAKAAKILGFKAENEITQTTVAEGNTTVVIIQYTLDMLVNTFELMPVSTEGDYSLKDYNAVYGSGGYQGKVLFLKDENTGYYFSHLGYNITVERNNERGGNVLRFHKSGADKIAQIYLTLTEEQKEALQHGGSLSFAFWKNGGTLQINGYDISSSSITSLEKGWSEVALTKEMLAVSAQSGTIHITLDSAGFLDHQMMVDDIIATDLPGYIVEHKYGDLLLKSEFVEAEIGSITEAKPTEIHGFVANGTIAQATVAEGNTTVITINYTRNMLIETFQHMPLTGSFDASDVYSIKSVGYDDYAGFENKVLYWNGVDTGYRFKNGGHPTATEVFKIEAAAQWDGTTGNIFRFRKSTSNKSATVLITLTDEQLAALNEGGSLSFYFKVNDYITFTVNGTTQTITATKTWIKCEFTKEMLETAKTTGRIQIDISHANSFNPFVFWVDDIAVTPAG